MVAVSNDEAVNVPIETDATLWMRLRRQDDNDDDGRNAGRSVSFLDVSSTPRIKMFSSPSLLSRRGPMKLARSDDGAPNANIKMAEFRK